MDLSTIPTTLGEAWLVILGAIALVVQAVIQKPSWSPRRKRGVTVAVAVVLGTLYAVAAGMVEGFPPVWSEMLVGWLVLIAGIIVVSQAVYRFFRPWLATIERATSPNYPGPAPDVEG